MTLWACLRNMMWMDPGDERTRQLESMPIVWAGVKNLVPSMITMPRRCQEGAKKVKEDMLTFNRKAEEFRATFLEEAPFTFNRTPDESYDVLDEQHKKLMEIETEAQELQNLQGLFELTVTEYKELQACRSEIVELKRLWDFISLVHNLFEFWMDQPFKDVDVDGLVEKTKSLSSEPFPPLVRTWDAYSGMKNEIKNMLVSLPLVQEPSDDEVFLHTRGLAFVFSYFEHASGAFCALSCGAVSVILLL